MYCCSVFSSNGISRTADTVDVSVQMLNSPSEHTAVDKSVAPIRATRQYRAVIATPALVGVKRYEFAEVSTYVAATVVHETSSVEYCSMNCTLAPSDNCKRLMSAWRTVSAEPMS
jgi:hypothetical protein